MLLTIISDIISYFPSLLYFHQNGWTLLIFTTSSGHSGVVKLLVGAGASTEVKDNESKRMFKCTYGCVCVCVCVSLEEGGEGGA